MTSSRKSRSDTGILALTKAVLQNVMGLTPDTAGKVMKVIRNSGQLQDLKGTMRGMNSMAYKRLNHVVDMVIKDQSKNKRNEEGPKGDEVYQAKSREENDQARKSEKRGVKESFINYLLTELQMDSETIRTDPEAKQDAIRLTRSNDAQAKSLEKRMSREKVQRDRKAIADETDPKKKSQRRQIMQREKQLQGLKDEVTGKDPNATDSGGATL